jgi:predicted dehydrogenase
MPADVRVLVIGCGNMGRSHAKAFTQLAGFALCGLVSRGASKAALDQELGGGHACYDDWRRALRESRPDAVCISTYPDTHEEIALAALAHGCHVFTEKPLATTVAGCERVIAAAKTAKRALVVGYILRHHPAWQVFIAEARLLGKPLVMRMNLNQQSHGRMWDVHRALMQSASPIVDCGVHYVDAMCQMTQSRPVRVNAIGARLSDELNPGMYNYGQLQVVFADGSVGWYEAGWGPMMSTAAFFVKDAVGPLGAVTIEAGERIDATNSDEVDAHTSTSAVRVHRAALDAANQFVHPDRIISMADEPDHDGLCAREQAYFLDAIRTGSDLSEHWAAARNSLAIVLAADASLRSGQTVAL